MDTFGQHLLVEYHGCDLSLLNDLCRIEVLMCAAAEAAGATVVTSAFHRFSPQGVSGVVVIEESHLSIHTWPESGYAATVSRCVHTRSYSMSFRPSGPK